MSCSTVLTTIASKQGSIASQWASDEVILLGHYSSSDSPYIDQLELNLNLEDGTTISYPLDFGGYNIRLFLGDFTNDGLDDILIQGTSGGSGDYAIANIYTFKNGSLEKIFSPNLFDTIFTYSSEYLPNERVSIASHKTQTQYIIDLRTNSSSSSSVAYTSFGQVQPNISPSVSSPNATYPIQLIDKPYYDLLIEQRVIGVTNSDTLGRIQTLITVVPEAFMVVNQSLLTEGAPFQATRYTDVDESFFLSLLPPDSRIITPTHTSSNGSILFEDLNHDGQNEVLLSYLLDNTPYLAIFAHDGATLSLVDTYPGIGQYVHDLMILPLKKEVKGILVGWEIGDLCSKLNILHLKNNRLVPLIQNTLPNYSFFDLIDFNHDGQAEIILWTHDIGEAYNVQVYEAFNTRLLPTSTYNTIYFQKVVDYYTRLLKTEPHSPTYLYYLALAQAKLGLSHQALETIDLALTHKSPYPSMPTLKRLQNTLKNKKRGYV